MEAKALLFEKRTAEKTIPPDPNIYSEYQICRNILAGVIDRAWKDIWAKGRHAKTLKAKALYWISRDDYLPGGFLWYCTLLDFEPEYWRAKMIKTKPQGRKLWHRVINNPMGVNNGDS